jgi:signal peptidase I
MSGLGVLCLVAIPWNPGAVIEGVVFLASAFGMRRLHAWSAYGAALLILVMTGVPLAGLLAEGNVRASLVLVSGVISLAIVLLLFFAGRALEGQYGRRGRAWPWAAGSVLAGAIFLFFGFFQTPTGSMEKTLLVGDHLAVWKTHGVAPTRGQLVVHHYPVNRKDIFIKRVVAIPGDRVRISNKQLFVNGTAVAEPYVEHATPYTDPYRDNFPSDPTVPVFPGANEMLANHVVNSEVVVPPDHYFVLGDNRDSSLDSRYWGFIEKSDIIGTPKMIYYSVSPAAETASKLPILNVRWNRIFRMVG